MRNNLRKFFAQTVALNFLKLAAGLAHNAGQIFIHHQGQNRMSGAHLGRTIVNRTKGPGLRQHIAQAWTQRRVACVAGFQAIQTTGQLCGQPGLIQVKLRDDGGKVAV